MTKFNVQKLIRARQLQKRSRAWVASKVGVTENMIYKIERGERASEKTIFKMSTVLEVPMEEILVSDGDAA